MWLLSRLSEKDKKEAIRRWNSNLEFSEFDAVSSESTSRTKVEVSYRERSVSGDEDEGRRSYDTTTNMNGGDDGYDTDPIDESEPGEFEAALGDLGDSFEIAELRVLAKYIAQTENWYNLNGRERFEPFHARVCTILDERVGSYFSLSSHLQYNQRSLASWKEYYRRKQKGEWGKDQISVYVPRPTTLNPCPLCT
jgi:hypothetical protein